MRTFFTKALLAAFCFTAFSLSSSSQTYNLHWGSVGWTGPTYSKTITNIGGSGVDASVAITNSGSGGNTSNAGAVADNNAFQYNSPTVGAANNAWWLPGSTNTNPLVLYVDWDNLTSNVTTKITFSKAVSDVSFYVGDLDRSATVTYVDRVTVTGKNGAAAVPNPAITKYMATKGTVDTVLINANQAWGNSDPASGNAATTNLVRQGGTVKVQFSSPVTEMTIVWDEGPNATGNPTAQAFIIGDIDFTKVIPLHSQAPTAANFENRALLQTATATAIPAPLAADVDGTIASYTIATIPTAAQGVLSCCGGTAVTAGQILTSAQINTLQFAPNSTFVGTASFTFTATDNDGLVSNSATYKLPVSAISPVANNMMENSMLRTGGATSIQPLSGADPDGTVASFTIVSLPAVSEGVLTCCGGVPVTAGQSLTVAQASTLKFAPNTTFTGDASFIYKAVDNSGNSSNNATCNIPVSAAVSATRPPLSDNITAQQLNNSLPATAIPALSASDLDGSVMNYTVVTIPAASQGVLTCCGGSAVTAGQVLTPAQAVTLQFAPVATFTGTASFTYKATDDDGLTGNTANYFLPIVNRAPLASNINTVIPFGSSATSIPTLAGSDADGTITSFTVSSIPAGSQGTLTCCGGTPVTVNQSLTSAQAATLQFTPVAGFSGTASFTYTATDNTGNVSSVASYTIGLPVQPPTTTDVVNPSLANTAAATAITPITATDADGTIANYMLYDIPDASQGVLTCCGGTTVTAGQSLTPAQVSTFRFAPNSTYSGLVSLKFAAVDNSGLLSNISTYTIPVSGTGNIPPIAKNVKAPAMASTAGATSIPAFSASDVDGTIASYTISAVPPASRGILTCCGGSAVTAGQVLTPAQAVTLQFAPASGFVGKAEFPYFSTDNGGFISAGAIYTIPVTGKPPVATAVQAAPMFQTAGATAIPSLLATDVDGNISNYTIEIVPAASQGALTCCGGVAVTAGQVLTPAQISTLQFAPSVSYRGSVIFTYHATDNSGLLSNSTTYTIPVRSLIPTSKNVVSNKILNSAPATSITALSSSDVDGSIASYTILSVPPSTQGVLTCCSGIAITAGQSLTPAQSSTLKFAPAAGFIGNAVFNYSAYDNSGNISNVATYTMPVGSSVTLPLSLVSFSAERNGENIGVNWKAANEVEMDQYEVEFSTGTGSFASGSVVKAKNQLVSSYTTTLVNYTAPLYYLRLKAMEKIGKASYSQVITIRLANNGLLGLSMAPNPVVSTMLVKINVEASGNADLRVINMVGEKVLQQTNHLMKGENMVTIDRVTKLVNGSYVLQATIDGKLYSERFVIQK